MNKRLIFLSYLLVMLFSFINISLCRTYLYALSVENIFQITETPNDMESDLIWSLDGNKLAFNLMIGLPGMQVATINIDGSNYRQLTTDTSHPSGYPSWSPDGLTIAYVSTSPINGKQNYWLMNSDGSNQHQITNFEDSNRYELAWTSDGTKLIFRSPHEGGVQNLFSMNIDGSNMTKLTSFSFAICNFSYCPKNDKIVFNVNNTQGGGQSDIWMMNVDGSNKQQLTFNSLNYDVVEWSPDGSNIAYTLQGKNKGLYLMDSEGNNHRLVYQFPNNSCSFEGWSSSGNYMALRLYNPNDVDSYYSLWVTKSDGADLTQISNGYIEDIKWSPLDNGTIAFALRYPYPSFTINDIYVATLDETITVKVLSPNGAEVIPSGSTYTIQWNASPEAVKFKLEYSENNGTSWLTIADNVIGTSYNWSVPSPVNNKTQCRVRVTAYNASDEKVGEDMSDSTFTIEVVKMTLPNGGEVWTSGTTETITWDTTNLPPTPVAKHRLRYTKDGQKTWKTIVTRSGNPGSYNWKVPTVLNIKKRCRVKVVLFDSLGSIIGSDKSDKVFTIHPVNGGSGGCTACH